MHHYARIKISFWLFFILKHNAAKTVGRFLVFKKKKLGQIFKISPNLKLAHLKKREISVEGPSIKRLNQIALINLFCF